MLNYQKIKLEDSDLLLNNSLINNQLLLKEIHHRVKNNLQLIISLQNIQARRNINGTITDFLIKEQSRITTMALIHQSLYQNDDMGNIDIGEYINNLVQHIKDSETENKISIELTFNKLYFDLETALPLGLIINELIANSYKHAFPDGISGTITISIVKLFENNFRLTYSDNGIPFTNKTDDNKHFGLELIQLLVKQLKGTILPFVIEKKEFTILFYTINVEI
jgi:two-component sensor histidine kinase